jgi:hypothetical protein
MDLRAGLYFIVAEHKSFANREKAADEAAIGRPLSVAWLEKKDTTALGDRSNLQALLVDHSLSYFCSYPQLTLVLLAHILPAAPLLVR